jgi:Xaa-Pro aminopeptidase/Xaa-Pro dipeptidase
VSRLPAPADFAAPPTARRLRAWEEADRAARPDRLGRLRSRLAAAGIDAYFGLRREEIRYLAGVVLGEGEAKVAGHSGRFLVTADEVVVLADSRYTLQARREAPGARVEDVTYDLAARWPSLLASIGARCVAVPAGDLPHAQWEALRVAAPDVELVPAGPWIDEDRAVKEPAEVERIAAAAAVADRALAALLPEIHPGVTEAALAWRLEVLMREGGAEALAFDVAALAGPQAALPHGSPGPRRICTGRVLLFDFGAQVGGYRSDMTRTLFVGAPRERDLAIYDLVAKAQVAAIDLLARAVAAGGPLPSGRAVDAAARDRIAAAGHGSRFGHGTGHGIGLATHERPSLSRVASDDPLPSPTVFSVEPGVYLAGRTGVRIEDLVLVDASGGRLELLTCFPREPLVLPA